MISAPRRRPRPSRDESPRWATSKQTIVIALIAFAVFVYFIHQILLPFIIAGVIAYICTPLIDRLARHAPRTLVASLVFLVLISVAAGLALLGVPPLIRQAGHVAGDFGGTIERLISGLVGNHSIDLFGKPMASADIARIATTGAQQWIAQGDTLLEFTTWSFAAIFGLFLTIVLLCYFLIGGKGVAAGLSWLVPPDDRPFASQVWAALDPLLKRYFLGVLAVVAFASVVAYLGLGLILGLHHAVFLALMTGLLETIPILGPALAIAGAGLVAIQEASGIGAIIGYAVYATLLRLSIDQVFGPLALGRAARVHPTLVIFCFLAGGFLFGVAGVILAVPTALTVKTLLSVLYDDDVR